MIFSLLTFPQRSTWPLPAARNGSISISNSSNREVLKTCARAGRGVDQPGGRPGRDDPGNGIGTVTGGSARGGLNHPGCTTPVHRAGTGPASREGVPTVRARLEGWCPANAGRSRTGCGEGIRASATSAGAPGGSRTASTGGGTRPGRLTWQGFTRPLAAAMITRSTRCRLFDRILLVYSEGSGTFLLGSSTVTSWAGRGGG